MVIGRQKCVCAPIFESDSYDTIVQSKPFNTMHIPDGIYVWSKIERMYKCSMDRDDVILKTYYECGERRFTTVEDIRYCPFCGKKFE